ncbi:MAG: PAS/PAC sensor signal transduction histidine kinase [Methanolobus sp. T82-4]|nr:MAG: PAS/PAC sensor signal transduction histidine kinase [Methanolobus sp. T82-4]
MTPSVRPRILIADDEPMNVELLEAYLSSDYDIITAYGGLEAFEKAVAEKPDLVLLDVMMPDMNGYQVCEMIKQSAETRFMPVVLVTALSGREDRLKGMESHADDFLTKPIDGLELKMRVMSLLRIKSLHDRIIFERDQAQSYLDVAGVMILVFDKEQKVTLVNKRATEILGYEESEILGNKWFETFVPEYFRPTSLEKYLDIMHSDNGDIVYSEGPLLARNGEEKIISWYSKSLKDDNGHPVGILSSGEDITLRKRVEECLKHRTTAMESSVDGIAILDERGHYVYVNAAHARIHGYDSPDELLGRSWKMLYGESEIRKIYETVIPAFSMKGEWKGESIGLRKDGSSFFQEISLTALDNGVICIVRDTTQRKEAEKQLKEYAGNLQSLNEMKDLFTDILRHDLLNPAGIAKGFTTVLMQDETDPARLERLKLIDNNIKRLIDMIESAAQFAKLEDLEHLEFKVMDLRSILCDVAKNFEMELGSKNISLEMDLDRTYPAMLNPVIEGVFSNYLSNAIKYGPSESIIKIEIEDLGEEWKVKVTDNGDGIPDTEKSGVFERFKRLSEKKKGVKGTGLGLAIAKRTIDLHGGRVGVDNNPEGRGSVFWASIRKA